MSATLTEAPPVDPPAIPAVAPRGQRGVVALAVAGVVAVVAGVVVAGGGLVGGSTTVEVTPSFDDASIVVASAWGDDRVDADGSWIASYRDGASTTMRVPWTGGEVVDARLGDGPVDLLAVTAVDRVDDELVLTVTFGGCAYYHERALQVLPTVTVTGTDGDLTTLTLDRPLFVRSPMLWQCPGRVIDRQARQRNQLGRTSP